MLEDHQKLEAANYYIRKGDMGQTPRTAAEAQAISSEISRREINIRANHKEMDLDQWEHY